MRVLRNCNVAPCRGDESTFAKRWQALYSHWRQHKDEMWGSADFFAIATPHPCDDIGYLKSSTFNRWLLGYEFPETVTVFGNKQIHFLCGQKKNASLLKSVKRLAKCAVDVDVVIHRKLKGRISKKMDDVINIMRMSNSEVVVGYIAKESSPEGSSVLEKWAYKLKNCGLQLSDVTNGLSHLLAIKDPDELSRQKNDETARRLASRDSSADCYGANLNELNDAYCGPKLVLTENKPISLSYLYIHPPFGGQPGELEAHANGFRYSTSGGDQPVDIMYANIKLAFFQPEETFLTVSLIHFHLHNHIMVGDKKTKYVQFSIESKYWVDTVEGKKSWNFDEIEIRDRGYYEDANIGKTDFQYFVSRVEEGLWLQPEFKKLNLKFERVVDQLGFAGTIAPNKTLTYIIPTSKFLVELMFTPFLVIPFSEIEIVNLERVGFSGQTDFDMSIVFKDFKRDVKRIDFILYKFYKRILEWLDRSGVQYFETRVNVRWRAIMKTFTDDPQVFTDVGGWDFLNREKEIFIENGGGFMDLDPAQTDFWPDQYGYYRDRLNSDSEEYDYSGQYDFLYNSDNSIDDTGCSAPKQRRLKKAVFSNLRVGPCFSASKRRRRIKKKKAFGPGSCAPKRSIAHY